MIAMAIKKGYWLKITRHIIECVDRRAYSQCVWRDKREKARANNNLASQKICEYGWEKKREFIQRKSYKKPCEMHHDSSIL